MPVRTAVVEAATWQLQGGSPALALGLLTGGSIWAESEVNLRPALGGHTGVFAGLIVWPYEFVGIAGSLAIA